MLYGTRTAGARQASSHPEIAENAGNRDHTVLYIHLVLAELVLSSWPPRAVLYGGATVMSNSLVYGLSVRLSFTCQPLIFAWVETSQPTTYCKCVVYSTSPKTTPFGARPAQKAGECHPRLWLRTSYSNCSSHRFCSSLALHDDHLSGWWVGTPGSGPRRAPTCTPVHIRKS